MNAREFLDCVVASNQHATVITLSGELGAGKTTFAQHLARQLGIDDSVTSPTYVLEKIYALSGKRWKKLVHVDWYRLDDASQFDSGIFRLILSDPTNLVVIEWPEKMEKLIPSDAIRVRIDIQGKERIIFVNGEERGTFKLDK